MGDPSSIQNVSAVASILGVMFSLWAAGASTLASRRTRRVERYFVLRNTLEERSRRLNEANADLDAFITGRPGSEIAARESAALIRVECEAIRRYAEGPLDAEAKATIVLAKRLEQAGKAAPEDAKQLAKELKIRLSGLRAALVEFNRSIRSGESV